MAESKARKMSAKGFLRKTSTKAANSAIAFLSQYREYLETGELAERVSPILLKLDQGELLPTPALKEIQAATMAHIIARDAENQQEKTEKAVEQQAASTSVSSSARWITTIYDAAGVIQTRINNQGEEEDLIKGFALNQDADRWADRRLFDGAHGWYAEVVNAINPNLVMRIERPDAIARILKKKKTPVIHERGKSTKSLGFGVKVRESHCSFSSG